MRRPRILAEGRRSIRRRRQFIALTATLGCFGLLVAAVLQFGPSLPAAAATPSPTAMALLDNDPAIVDALILKGIADPDASGGTPSNPDLTYSQWWDLYITDVVINELADPELYFWYWLTLQ